MPATVVVGLQWGDEGKGKTTDLLAERVAMVVRYQGGDNAGHTVVLGDEVFKLHLVPSGVLHPHITPVIGNGVVVNPATLIDEMAMLAARGIDIDRVRVSRAAHVIMPYHIALDKALETRLAGDESARRDRGIGPAYADRALADRAPDGRPARPRRSAPQARARPAREERGARANVRPAELRPRRARRRRRSAGASGCGRTSPTRRSWSRTPWRAASTCCSRAPRARCSTSTTAPTRT